MERGKEYEDSIKDAGKNVSFPRSSGANPGPAVSGGSDLGAKCLIFYMKLSNKYLAFENL